MWSSSSKCPGANLPNRSSNLQKICRHCSTSKNHNMHILIGFVNSAFILDGLLNLQETTRRKNQNDAPRLMDPIGQYFLLVCLMLASLLFLLFLVVSCCFLLFLVVSCCCLLFFGVGSDWSFVYCRMIWSCQRIRIQKKAHSHSHVPKHLPCQGCWLFKRSLGANKILKNSICQRSPIEFWWRGHGLWNRAIETHDHKKPWSFSFFAPIIVVVINLLSHSPERSSVGAALAFKRFPVALPTADASDAHPAAPPLFGSFDILAEAHTTAKASAMGEKIWTPIIPGVFLQEFVAWFFKKDHGSCPKNIRDLKHGANGLSHLGQFVL